MRWLRGAQEDPCHGTRLGRALYRVAARDPHPRTRRASEQTRLQQFLAAIDASPNGVLLLDAGDGIEMVQRVAAAFHFGSTAARPPAAGHQPRARAGLRRLPAVPGLGRGHDAQPARHSLLSVLIRPYGESQKLVLSQDITERERSETMRRNFVANVSHELRTPLTVLAGFIETMSAFAHRGRKERVLGLMGQQAQRMQALVADLLTLARLEDSPRPPTDRWVALGPAAGSCRGRGSGAVRRAARPAVRRPGGRRADRGQRGRAAASAIGNLVANAVRYTPTGARSW